MANPERTIKPEKPLKSWKILEKITKNIKNPIDKSKKYAIIYIENENERGKRTSKKLWKFLKKS